MNLSKKCPKHRLLVYGVLNEVDFQMAKCCAEDLFNKSPDLFKKPHIEPMLEFEWSEFIEKKIKELKGELWSFNNKTLIFLGDDALGGPKELITWAESVDCYENYRPMSLYEVLANEAYKSHVASKNHTFVYMDFTIDESPIGRIIIELYDDIVPDTCRNFRMLCTGELGSAKGSEVRLHYKRSIIHRVVPGGWIQGGDIKALKGNDGISIYGDVFSDENFIVKHDKRGVVGMANKGPHTNASQFYITLQPATWMDTKYVAFGQVVDGSSTLKIIEKQATQNDRPTKEILITNVGRCPLDS
ncbi:hypothetical protein HELRODRAFT_108746 [Helobdella robusta]|uniref:Peptidyl-prolyl cis-trans isomerase n=1 Tax=Helobdella robusta TaxID=6412 RepID=T1EEM2_HELRO|nr:hypothetical protein HELRODRAFT_108746 [Helobdella robusta]ESN90692.1 hypothetical protein HELRODRAFT_108746 [Helobdella robusta]